MENGLDVFKGTTANPKVGGAVHSFPSKFEFTSNSKLKRIESIIKTQTQTAEFFESEIARLRKTTLDKAAQRLKLGQSTGVKSIDSSIAGGDFSQFKNLNKVNIRNMLEKSVQSKDIESVPEMMSKATYAREEMNRYTGIKGHLQETIKKVSERVKQRGIMEAGVSGELQGSPDLTQHFQGVNTQRILNEQAAIDRFRQRQWMQQMAKNQRQWMQQMAKNNRGIKFFEETPIENGSSLVPENFASILKTEGSGNSMKLSAGLASKIQNANISRTFNGVKNMGGIATTLLNPKNIPMLSQMFGKMNGTQVFNPFAGFKQAGILGKGIKGLGVLGLTAYGAYNDFKDAHSGEGSYMGASANLANNLLAYAGPIGFAGSMANDFVVNRVNKYEGYQNQITDESGRGQFLDMQRRLLPRLKEQQKNKKAKALILQTHTHELSQQELYEQMANDPTHAQGMAREALRSIAGPLGLIDTKDKYGNKYGIKGFNTAQKGTLEATYRVMHPEDKKMSGYNGYDFAKYMQGHGSEVEQKMTGAYGRTLPTYTNDRTATSLSRTPIIFDPSTGKSSGGVLDGKTTTYARELQNNLTVGDYSNIGKKESGGKVDEMISILRELAQQGVDQEGEKQLEQQVTFSTLPINININDTTKLLSPDVDAAVHKITDELAKALQELDQRVTSMDGQAKPAKRQAQ
jgi:hypothetical protein